MMKFEVWLSKVYSVKAEIEAEDSNQAEEIAMEQFLHGEIELSDSGIPGDVRIAAMEAANPFDVIPIYWGDLTPEKQAEILEAFGDNCNYDVVPIMELPVF